MKVTQTNLLKNEDDPIEPIKEEEKLPSSQIFKGRELLKYGVCLYIRWDNNNDDILTIFKEIDAGLYDSNIISITSNAL